MGSRSQCNIFTVSQFIEEYPRRCHLPKTDTPVSTTLVSPEVNSGSKSHILLCDNFHNTQHFPTDHSCYLADLYIYIVVGHN